ncbi:thymidine phosphorylase, partial [candidate division WOR-3 bacterium]|nr:thymidine phosphorylase [candidate division WOR-3 bacterium]
MYIPDIIKKKRDGKNIRKEDFEFIINGYVNNKIPDYQVSSFLMACFINGLSKKETYFLTETMMKSGDMYDFSDIDGIKVDKHSTGGVGDKVSIPLAPLLASLGFYVPMVSGRGLGHSGGTLDKLESINGFNVNLSAKKFKTILKNEQVVMAGQTE